MTIRRGKLGVRMKILGLVGKGVSAPTELTKGIFTSYVRGKFHLAFLVKEGFLVIDLIPSKSGNRPFKKYTLSSKGKVIVTRYKEFTKFMSERISVTTWVCLGCGTVFPPEKWIRAEATYRCPKCFGCRTIKAVQEENEEYV